MYKDGARTMLGTLMFHLSHHGPCMIEVAR